MWRVLREHVKGFERACGGLREKVLQSRKASTAENMKFSEKIIIVIKSDNILPYFKANLFSYQTLPLTNHTITAIAVIVHQDVGTTERRL